MHFAPRTTNYHKPCPGIWLFAACFVLMSILTRQAQSHIADTSVIRVTEEQLLQAMSREHGYDPAVTTNVARFQAAVILSVVREVMKTDPEGAPLMVDHKTWFKAFLQHLNLSESSAPGFARLAYEHKQDQLIEYRRQDFNSHAEHGEQPRLILNVCVSWPDSSTLPASYSFDDTTSKPNLRVTNARHIRYWLLDFGDMVVYDQIQGLSGRPTSGVLGLLFRIIGEGQLVQSRIVITKDGLQISRTRARKGRFKVAPVVTIWPDGRMEKGIPDTHANLPEVKAGLNRSINTDYASHWSHP